MTRVFGAASSASTHYDRPMTTAGTRLVDLGGLELSITEQGEGPAVVLCHGFPGLGYSFRHQMAPLAAAGYRAIAPDMPGYGRSFRPSGPHEVTYAHITRVLVGLLDALGIDQAFFVGHDFGAPSAWNVALRAPDRVAGLVILSVPYDPDRSSRPPSEIYAAMAEKHFLHIHYFQEPGVAEAELDPNPEAFLTRLYWALSGQARYLDVWKHPSEGRGYLDVLPKAPPLPWSFMSRAEMDHYVSVFRKTGFGGGLDWYRAFDANWEEAIDYEGAPLVVPTLFVAGSRDAVMEMRGDAGIARMRETIPDLRGVHLLEGAGHWVQMEAAHELNGRLLEFLGSVR